MPPRKSLRRAVGLSALLGVGGVLYAREVEPRRTEVTRVEIRLPRLPPAFDGYRVVQIGDIHLDDWSNPERLLGVTERVNGLRPDLVAIMGDFASYSARKLDERRLTQALRGLSARDGVVTILGNHDYLTDVALIRRCIHDANITELINDVFTLRRGDSTLYIAGVDSVMEGRSRLDLVLEKLPEDAAAILLAHEPDFADVAAATGRFGLQLSGHSHGGQIRLPLLTRLVLPPFSQRYTSGLHEVGDMSLYTNRGLGFVHARVRLFCRPEITVITLRPTDHVPPSASRNANSTASRE